MSRGPGHVQRTILALIADQPHGAWSTSDLCRKVYRDYPVTRTERVAVTRALRSMTLPGTWSTQWESHARERFLCDPCDLASMSYKVHRFTYSRHHLEPGGMIFEAVERAKRWRDGSPVERLDMQIEHITEQARLLASAGMLVGDVAKSIGEEVARLNDEKTRLAEGA